MPLRQASRAGLLVLLARLWGLRSQGARAEPGPWHIRSQGADHAMCRDGAEEWSENSGTLRNNATLVDLGVANQALQHEDIEVAAFV